MLPTVLQSTVRMVPSGLLRALKVEISQITSILLRAWMALSSKSTSAKSPALVVLLMATGTQVRLAFA